MPLHLYHVKLKGESADLCLFCLLREAYLYILYIGTVLRGLVNDNLYDLPCARGF